MNDPDINIKNAGPDFKKLFLNIIQNKKWGKSILVRLESNGEVVIRNY